jgi:AraC family transcriptional regulator
MLRIAEQGYAPESSKRPHAHELPSISMVVAGALRERMGRAEEIARPLSISVMPAGVAHADEFSPDGARLLSIHMDAATAQELASEHGTLGPWRWTHGGASVRLFLRLLAALRSHAPQKVTDLIATDVVAATLTGVANARDGTRAPRWLVHVRAAIDDCASWPSVSELAAVGGVHRVHLARQFRRYHGCAVSDYVRRRNVQRAAQRMLRSPVSLCEIAHDAGFSDQPHMCRAFRTETGMSPSAFRSLSGDGKSKACHPEPAGEGSRSSG